MMDNWRNKKAAVLGMGVEGVSSARFLIKKGAIVTVLDKKKEEELPKEDINLLRNQDIKIITGENYLKNLSGYDVIVRSPGVKRDLKELIAAETRLPAPERSDGGQEKGAVITSQTKIFFDLCPSPIIGVTGTKGKGTTSTLIYEMLKKQGFDAYLGGNIGNPPLDFLDKLGPQSWVVLELSSFQLIDLAKSPHIAVLLMMTSEHLDYHKDMYEYVDAKRNMLRFQKERDFAVINTDYLASNESDIHTDGKVFRISREREVGEGVSIKDNGVWLRKNGNTTKIINSSEILLPGKHNLENVAASVMAATLARVSKENIVKVLKTFKGLEHRLELVGEIKGVRYYDDSFSTTPETAIAAIQAFASPEILILGGSSKGSDFRELGQVISNAKNIKAIIGIGAEWKQIKLKIRNEKLKIIEGCKNMKEIVQAAFDAARPGDLVLLSPACSSFDMFEDYKDRGEKFKREVRKLES